MNKGYASGGALRMTRPVERDALRRMHGSIRELVEASGYEYVWSELIMEEGRPVLRVLLDSLGGINVKDCEVVSRKLGRMLDDLYPGLPDRYFLQVSSPGVERPLMTLSDYGRFAGKRAKVRLKEGVDGRKNLTGTILSASGDVVRFDEDELGEVALPFADISRANLLFEMPGPSGPEVKGKKKRGQQ